MSRFDYVKYDEEAVLDQESAKAVCTELELLISSIGDGRMDSAQVARAKALAFTKLEECYMWIGKAIRDSQIQRNGSAPLQEERKDS